MNFKSATTSQKSNNSCGWGRRKEKLFVFPIYQASIVRQANKSDGWAMEGGRLINFCSVPSSINSATANKSGGWARRRGRLFVFL